MARYYTVEEANAALPRLRPLVGRLVAAHARITEARPALQGVFEKASYDSGSAEASRVVIEFERLERALLRINQMGVEVKDMSSGLCDFVGFYGGRELNLCWRYGEPRVEWWHELHTGFRGRRHVRELTGEE